MVITSLRYLYYIGVILRRFKAILYQSEGSYRARVRKSLTSEIYGVVVNLSHQQTYAPIALNLYDAHICVLRGDNSLK